MSKSVLKVTTTTNPGEAKKAKRARKAVILNPCLCVSGCGPLACAGLSLGPSDSRASCADTIKAETIGQSASNKKVARQNALPLPISSWINKCNIEKLQGPGEGSLSRP